MDRISSDVIPPTISGLLERRNARTPREDAFFHREPPETGGWSRVKWGDLYTQVLQFSDALRHVGVAPGTRVAILLGLDPIWEAIAHAVYRNRAVLVSLDMATGANDIGKILQHCGVSTLVTDTRGWKKLEKESTVDATVTTVLANGDPNSPRTKGCLYLERLIAESERRAAFAEQRLPAPDDLATIVYTSGTTGEAKGIAYRHEQVMAACGALVEAYGELGPEDRTVCWLPLSAMFQRMANLLSMACGMTTYFVEDPRSILQQLEEIQPSFFIGVPRFYEKLENALSSGESSLPLARSLQQTKLMISGSAPIPVNILRSLQRRGLSVREAYGLSENTVPVALNRLSDYRFGSVGKPLPPNEVVLADDGEVLVRGLGVFEGYVGDGPSQDLFNADGFYRTGDIGRFDEDGFLFLIGRKRDLIKTSTGRRIGPSRIEAAYAQCGSIDQILVIGEGRKYLAAIVVVSPDAADRLRGEPLRGGAGDASTNAEMRSQTSVESDAGDLLAEWLAAGESLGPEEQIQAFGVLPHPFREDEVTTSQKLRRSVIQRRYSALIDRIYAQRTPCIVIASEDDLALPDDDQSRRGT